MRKLVILAALAVMAPPGFVGHAAQPVTAETVDALRQMAIEAGQTSRSRIQGAATDDATAAVERDAIERHRNGFLSRAYGDGSENTTARPPQEATKRPLQNAWAPSRTGQGRLSPPVEAAPSVDRETIAALRRLAIDAGQVSRSSNAPANRSAPTVDAERRVIEAHRAGFFARAFGSGPAS